MQNVAYIRFNNFRIHFTITVMLKITFLQGIAIVQVTFDLIINFVRSFKIDAGGDGKQLIY